MKEVGEIFSYYAKIGVAAVKLKSALKVGDKIKIQGHTTNFEQEVDGIQIEHEKVEKAKKGDDVGIKVSEKVRKHDKVFLAE